MLADACSPRPGCAGARPFLFLLGFSAFLVASRASAQSSDDSLTVMPNAAPISCTDVRSGALFTHFARRVTSGGLVDSAWVPPPTLSCLGSLEAPPNAMAEDGSGGKFVAWEGTAGGEPDVVLQRLRPDGSRTEDWPAAGVVVAGGPASQYDISLAADLSGGVYVCWQEVHRSTGGDIYLQRVSGHCSPAEGWPAGGKAVCREANDQTGPRIAPDGTGGVLLVWQDRRSGCLQLYGTRIDSSGTVVGSWGEDGTQLTALSGAAESPALLSNGHDAAIVAWRQVEPGVPVRLLALAVAVGTTPVPPQSGQPAVVTSVTGTISDPAIGADSAGFVVAWSEGAGAAGSVRAQHFTAAGKLIATWPPGGVVVGGSSPGQSAPALSTDGQSGQVIGWEELTEAGSDVHVQRIGPAGAIADGWAQMGVAIARESGEQYAPIVGADGSGGALVTWSDASREASGRFYTLTASGVRLEVHLVRAAATPGKARITWQVLLPEFEDLRVERRVDEEAWTSLSAAAVNDSHQVVVQDASAPEGVHASYRLVAMIGQASYHFQPVSLQIPIAPARLELRWIRASGPSAFTIACAIPRGGTPVLEVFDVSGRRVMEPELSGLEPGEHTLSFSTPSRMHSGMYFVRLRQDREVRKAKLVFVR